MPAVQKIACSNNGGYVMQFWVDIAGGLRTPSSGNYPLGTTRTIDLGDLPIQDGTDVWPVVDVFWGKTVSGPTVQFAKNGQVATYECSGTTLSPKVTLIGSDAVTTAGDGSPPDPWTTD
jgi:hypothetical protein